MANVPWMLPTEDGWNGPRSKATAEAALRTAENVAFVPLNSGGIQIELHAGGVDLEIVVNADGTFGSVFWDDVR